MKSVPRRRSWSILASHQTNRNLMSTPRRGRHHACLVTWSLQGDNCWDIRYSRGVPVRHKHGDEPANEGCRGARILDGSSKLLKDGQAQRTDSVTGHLERMPWAEASEPCDVAASRSAQPSVEDPNLWEGQETLPSVESVHCACAWARSG